MAVATLPPMAEGGKWILISGHERPTYVVHEAHITRLMLDGGRVVDDPRRPEDFVKPEPKPDANVEALQKQVAELQAALQQVLAQKAEPAKK